MEGILIWLLVQMLTKASEKWKVSQTYLAIWLAVVLGVGYYILSNYFSIEWWKMVEFVGGVYASSQIFYNCFRKRGLLDKNNEQK
jgi:hypothetical protein